MLMHDNVQLNQSFCVIFFKGRKRGVQPEVVVLQNEKSSINVQFATIKPKCELVRMGLRG